MQQDVWLENMQTLKQKHGEIADLIGGKSTALVDIPVYFNVGDLLIHKGTEAFFKQYNINIQYRAGKLNVDFKRLQDVDVILLHGGGNFGDLYRSHQDIKERIVEHFPNKRIICLPQSIHFNSEAALKRSAAIFNKHQDFHFYVRDSISFDIAQHFTSHVMMMPDMAHSLHPLVDRQEAGISNLSPPRILNLVRVDKEFVNQSSSIDKLSFDWENIITDSDEFTRKFYSKMMRLPFFKDKIMRLWANKCDDVVFRSTHYFLSFTQVHTDRLHGFILAALLGKEIYLKDNSYKKNTNYMKAWLKDYPYLHVVNTSTE